MKVALKFVLTFVILTATALCQSVFARTGNCNLRGYPSGSVVSIVMGDTSPGAVATVSGVILSSDGMIMTSYQGIKGAQSIQVRTMNHGNFDHAVLVAYDEASDLAVLRVDAKDLALPQSSSRLLTDEDPIYVVTRKEGDMKSTPAVAIGSVRSVKKANRVTGAQREYETVQFAAPLTYNAIGSALLDCEGRLAGMVTSRRDEQGFYIATAFSSMLDYAALSNRVFDSGKDLRMPGEGASEASVHKAEPKSMAKTSRTFYVSSRTSLIPRDHMIQALKNEKDFDSLDMVLTDDAELADVWVEVDYFPFTFDYTFKALEKKTKVVLAAGRVTEFNGYFAAPSIAKKMVNKLKAAKAAAPATVAAK